MNTYSYFIINGYQDIGPFSTLYQVLLSDQIPFMVSITIEDECNIYLASNNNYIQAIWTIAYLLGKYKPKPVTIAVVSMP